MPGPCHRGLIAILRLSTCWPERVERLDQTMLLMGLIYLMLGTISQKFAMSVHFRFFTTNLHQSMKPTNNLSLAFDPYFLVTQSRSYLMFLSESQAYAEMPAAKSTTLKLSLNSWREDIDLVGKYLLRCGQLFRHFGHQSNMLKF